jgi:hypothetical protein
LPSSRIDNMARCTLCRRDLQEIEAFGVYVSEDGKTRILYALCLPCDDEVDQAGASRRAELFACIEAVLHAEGAA